MTNTKVDAPATHFSAEQAAVLERTEQFARETLEKDSTGHDWWHILRVRNNARHVADLEKAQCNRYVVELAALLHDIADWKFHDGDLKAGSAKAAAWLNDQKVSPTIIEQVCYIIDNISYKGAGVKSEMKSLEGRIVQDADRLDSMGAIGIARTFAYGGFKERTLYDPEIKPSMHASFEEYKNSKGHTINHFYEKLLLLKDRLNTDSAKSIAERRHQFMVDYLDQFFAEWNGQD